MSEPTPINVAAFKPYDGGDGVRLAVSSTSGTTAVKIPGLSGGLAGNERTRVLVTNPLDVSIFIRMGQASVQATLNSQEILPNAAYLLTPPDTNPSGIFVAMRTESATGSVSICAGEGT